MKPAGLGYRQLYSENQHCRKRGNAVFTFGVCWADRSVVSFSSLGALFCCQFLFFWATLCGLIQICGLTLIWTRRSRQDSESRCWGETAQFWGQWKLLVISGAIVWRNKEFGSNGGWLENVLRWKNWTAKHSSTVPQLNLFSRACLSCQKCAACPPRLCFLPGDLQLKCNGIPIKRRMPRTNKELLGLSMWKDGCGNIWQMAVEIPHKSPASLYLSRRYFQSVCGISPFLCCRKRITK